MSPPLEPPIDEDEFRTATIEWGGWRFEIEGVESWTDFDDFNNHLEISGHVVSTERIPEDDDGGA